MAGLRDDVVPAPEDRGAVVALLAGELAMPENVGPAYRAGPGLGVRALMRISLASLALEARGRLGLTDAAVRALSLVADGAVDDSHVLGEQCVPYVEVTRERYARTRAAIYGATTNDADRDGLPDAADACPWEPEVFNGVDDDDGCPDEHRVEVVERQIVIHEHVRFETDSDVMLLESLDVLDDVADLLDAYPQIRAVRIDGHTDARGDAEYNQALSEMRAAAVRRYLTAVGIDADRLATRGYGESMPLSYADDPFGWSLNRRVEFTIVDADPIRVEQ